MNELVLIIYEKSLCHEKSSRAVNGHDESNIPDMNYKEYHLSKKNLIAWRFDKSNSSLNIKYSDDSNFASACITIEQYMKLNYSFETVLFMLKMIFADRETQNKFTMISIINERFYKSKIIKLRRM